MALAEELPLYGELAPEAAAKGESLARGVGASIRVFRKIRGLTLKQLAEACCTSPQTISRLETAEMTISMVWVQLITEALGIEPYMLFTGTSALGRANEEARKAKAEAAALRSAVRALAKMVEELVPESDGEAA